MNAQNGKNKNRNFNDVNELASNEGWTVHHLVHYAVSSEPREIIICGLLVVFVAFLFIVFTALIVVLCKCEWDVDSWRSTLEKMKIWKYESNRASEAIKPNTDDYEPIGPF